MFSSYTLNKR